MSTETLLYDGTNFGQILTLGWKNSAIVTNEPIIGHPLKPKNLRIFTIDGRGVQIIAPGDTLVITDGHLTVRTKEN